MHNTPSPVAPEAAAGGRIYQAPNPDTIEASAAFIELRFDSDVFASFRLLWDEAPHTCAAVTAALPQDSAWETPCFHAIYSGTVAAFLIDPAVTAPTENATTCVIPGDLLFTHYAAGFRHGHPNPLSEIYWPYDRYARFTIPGLFTPLTEASVFATFDGDSASWEAFAARSQRLRFDGASPLTVSTL